MASARFAIPMAPRGEGMLSYRAGQRISKFQTPQEWHDPIRVFRSSRVGGFQIGRGHAAITNDICIDHDHNRPARFQVSISRAVTRRRNRDLARRTDSSSAAASNGAVAAVATLQSRPHMYRHNGSIVVVNLEYF